jgi:hypothetical protein
MQHCQQCLVYVDTTATLSSSSYTLSQDLPLQLCMLLPKLSQRNILNSRVSGTIGLIHLALFLTCLFSEYFNFNLTSQAVHFDKLKSSVSHETKPIEWIRLNCESIASVIDLFLGRESAITNSKISKVYPVRLFSRWFHVS